MASSSARGAGGDSEEMHQAATPPARYLCGGRQLTPQEASAAATAAAAVKTAKEEGLDAIIDAAIVISGNPHECLHPSTVKQLLVPAGQGFPCDANSPDINVMKHRLYTRLQARLAPFGAGFGHMRRSGKTMGTAYLMGVRMAEGVTLPEPAAAELRDGSGDDGAGVGMAHAGAAEAAAAGDGSGGGGGGGSGAGVVLGKRKRSSGLAPVARYLLAEGDGTAAHRAQAIAALDAAVAATGSPVAWKALWRRLSILCSHARRQARDGSDSEGSSSDGAASSSRGAAHRRGRGGAGAKGGPGSGRAVGGSSSSGGSSGGGKGAR